MSLLGAAPLLVAVWLLGAVSLLRVESLLAVAWLVGVVLLLGEELERSAASVPLAASGLGVAYVASAYAPVASPPHRRRRPLCRPPFTPFSAAFFITNVQAPPC